VEAVRTQVAGGAVTRHGPQRIDDIFAELLFRRGYARELTAASFAQAWAEAVGPQWAAASRAGQLKRGVLEVFVENSTLLQELTFQKQALLAALAGRLPEQGISDLRFRLGAMR
jgi:predicted nucleic acid-binding Zn ribbon protein